MLTTKSRKLHKCLHIVKHIKPRLILQGRCQDLAGWGGGNNFFRIGNLHMLRSKHHAAHGKVMRFVRGVRGHALLRIFFEMVQFGAFWCIFGSDVVFKNTKIPFLYKKLPFFIIENNYFRYTL